MNNRVPRMRNPPPPPETRKINKDKSLLKVTVKLISSVLDIIFVLAIVYLLITEKEISNEILLAAMLYVFSSLSLIKSH